MVDITHKSNSLRTAIAGATVTVSLSQTIDTIKAGKVPKGDIFSMSKAAGLFAAKRTADMIPDCHPLPIEYTDIRFNMHDNQIDIEVEIHTIYKTGVEVEAMHAASVVALTMYDMLKPIDPAITINNIHLVEKTGGKKDYNKSASSLKIAVLVCSDSISSGEKTDRSGKVIVEKMEKFGASVAFYEIIPDNIELIQNHVTSYKSNQVDLILITGGTGVSPKDLTPEAIRPLLDKEIPGIAETIRHYGQQRMPYSMLSRSIAGFSGDTLIIALPGSVNGAAESIDAVFPAIFHLFKVRNFFRHE